MVNGPLVGKTLRRQWSSTPNLALAIDYLFRHRRDWRLETALGKTLVSSSMIDREATHLVRHLVEGPVGFKWFVDGLLDGCLGFAGEESAGAWFLRRDGTVWTTDKDGILLGCWRQRADRVDLSGDSPLEEHGHSW